jgi:hypothetical protein
MKPEDVPVFDALDDTEAAILTIYGEARGEPFEGKQAVGVVISNRAQRRRKTIKEICYAPNQFSCYLSSDMNYPHLLDLARWLKHPDQPSQIPRLFDCLHAWHDECPDVQKLLDGAAFYEVHGTKNEWFDKEKAAGKLIFTASIGHHDFYKEA